MADYEDQNSSEYKDMNQETQAADQNPQNDGQIPPQNNGQDPYWQNPQNDGQIPPQNPGQNPYWQNQQNSGQFPPQNGQPPYWQNQYNNGQPPYWQNQPQRPRREKNSFATISLISGIFALLTLCCFAFPVAIILGVIAVLLGIGEFFYVLTITNLMKDPANAAAFNEFFEQFQRQLGIN